MAREECPICDEITGKVGNHPGDGPLGDLERCELCGKLVCPVCLHSRDCCFEDMDERLEADPGYVPKGWVRTADGGFAIADAAGTEAPR